MTHLPPVLVTGGAGYIGSHMVKYLGAAGYFPITLDNLSTGHKDAVTAGAFFEGDIADKALLRHIFRTYPVEAVFHFAASSLVGESILHPEKYLHNNVTKIHTLLEAVQEAAVSYLIFSSSAAVYGNPKTGVPIRESDPLKPINPYGKSKLVVEKALQEFQQRTGCHLGILRYFNAAGADPEGTLCERHNPETHLIPLILRVAAGKQASLSIFGNNYSTPDGTCIRDYIHVWDLCEAHLLLLDYLKRFDSPSFNVFNLGSGRGYSVIEIIRAAQAVTGKTIPTTVEPRREGDPPTLVADPAKALETLAWKPYYPQIEVILQHAWHAMKNTGYI